MAYDFRQLTDQLERICSERLALRSVSLADAWPLFEATRNPVFNRHLLWEQPKDENELLQRVDAVAVASRLGRMAALSAVVKKTGEWVSLYRFQPYQLDQSAMEMGVWTHDRFWHGRYSLELVRLCIDAAFSNSPVERLVGSAKPDNRSSCYLMRAAGMAPTELLKRETDSGDFVQAQEFTITRSAWFSRKGTKPTYFAFPMAGEALQAVPISKPVPARVFTKPLEVEEQIAA